MRVQPLQHIEIDIPENVHEVILVEDTLLGKIRSRAFHNASTLYFFTGMFVIVLIAEFVSHVIWG